MSKRQQSVMPMFLLRTGYEAQRLEWRFAGVAAGKSKNAGWRSGKTAIRREHSAGFSANNWSDNFSTYVLTCQEGRADLTLYEP